jgi:hypothetical protein
LHWNLQPSDYVSVGFTSINHIITTVYGKYIFEFAPEFTLFPHLQKSLADTDNSSDGRNCFTPLRELMHSFSAIFVSPYFQGLYVVRFGNVR